MRSCRLTPRLALVFDGRSRISDGLRPERRIGLPQVCEQAFLGGWVDGADRLQFGEHISHPLGRFGVFGKSARDASQARVAGDDFFDRRRRRELAPFTRRSQLAVRVFIRRKRAAELRERAGTLRAGFFGSPRFASPCGAAQATERDRGGHCSLNHPMVDRTSQGITTANWLWRR